MEKKTLSLIALSKILILSASTQVLKWLQLPIGLLAVAVAFVAISFGGYFAIHELKEKDVKKIQKKRIQVVRDHLSTLVKKCEESKQVTDELESQFFDLFQHEYDQAHEPLRILSACDRSFLFSGVFFIVTILLDWANENFLFISSQQSTLTPIEIFIFLYGMVFLSIAFIDLERLRRITVKEDIDPPPFEGSVFIGTLLAIDLFFLYATLISYSTLTPFGKSLFVASLLPLIGAPITFFNWEKKRTWMRNVGLILLVAPFFLISAWLLLSVLGIL